MRKTNNIDSQLRMQHRLTNKIQKELILVKAKYHPFLGSLLY